MNCRTKERREWIVANYYVEPKAHIKLLANQMKTSDAGGPIEDQYYIFQAINKTNGQKESIICGMGAARDFLRLLNHKGLSIFNPIHGEVGQHDRKNNIHNNGEAWNPKAKQLYNAIMWIITIIDVSPNTTIYEIKSCVEKYKKYEPYESKIKGINTIIARVFKGATLTTKIDELRNVNDIRNDTCEFNLLIDVINNSTDKEGNPIIPYF